jgi:hypothetical protein
MSVCAKTRPPRPSASLIGGRPLSVRIRTAWTSLFARVRCRMGADNGNPQSRAAQESNLGSGHLDRWPPTAAPGGAAAGSGIRYGRRSGRVCGATSIVEAALNDWAIGAGGNAGWSCLHLVPAGGKASVNRYASTALSVHSEL